MVHKVTEVVQRKPLNMLKVVPEERMMAMALTEIAVQRMSLQNMLLREVCKIIMAAQTMTVALLHRQMPRNVQMENKRSFLKKLQKALNLLAIILPLQIGCFAEAPQQIGKIEVLQCL